MTCSARIKAETFDIMQYFYGSVHHPLIRCVLRFDGHIREEVLKNAVNLSICSVPQLSCCFCARGWRPFWQDCGFTAENMVSVTEEAADYDKQCEKLLTAAIDITSQPPLKISLVKGESSDTLCITVHHMLCDAAGFKEYLYLLCAYYNFCCGLGARPDSKPYSRRAGLLFSNMSFMERIRLLTSQYPVPGHEKQLTFSMQGGSKPAFVFRGISADQFLRIKQNAKSRNATVNDALLTAYIRVLHRELGLNSITVPCPVDLRKYLPAGCKYGITNLTSNYICQIDFKENETFEETLKKVSDQMKQQKSDKRCLKGVFLLDFIFHMLPFPVLQRIFPKIFTIPVVSYSNLGIVDGGCLRFGNAAVQDVRMAAAVKKVPYFQLTVSTFDCCCCLNSNLYASEQDKEKLKRILNEIEEELLVWLN